jgi:hypothetical protein
MRRILLSLAALTAVAVGSTALYGQVPYVTYYTPSTTYYSPPAAVSYSTPTVTYSAPVSYYRAPTYTYYPARTYYPRTTYYAPSPYYSSSTVTRYRPFVGGTVSRYVTSYPPVYYSW